MDSVFGIDSDVLEQYNVTRERGTTCEPVRGRLDSDVKDDDDTSASSDSKTDAGAVPIPGRVIRPVREAIFFGDDSDPSGSNSDDSDSADGSSQAQSLALPEAALSTTPDSRKISALTAYLAKQGGASSTSNFLQLRIYLPDFSPMRVELEDTATFARAIAKVLEIHQSKGMQPPLKYNTPNIYELCMHEGDGEPDRDFMFDKARKVKEFYNPDRPNVNEYCLCVSTSSSSSARGRASLSQQQDGVGASGAKEHLGTTSVRVTIPSAGNNLLFHDLTPTTTLLDLLHLVTRKCRINLFTNQFSFMISSEDQTRLKLMSNVLDMKARVLSVGTQTFSLHKKSFQDASKIQGSKRKPVGALSSVVAREAELPAVVATAPSYTDDSATGYEEWNVLKKNYYGLSQQRVIGVDGKKIYNHKRGESRTRNNVTHAERNIADIVVIVPGPDKKSFKLTFKEGPSLVDVEYVCEEEEHATRIMAKINFIKKVC